jgi:hypothetical protein
MDENKIKEFVNFCGSLSGTEKSEAQTFINRLMMCFGYKDTHDAGGKFEYPCTIRQKDMDRNGFVDCVIPGKAIIEMKSCSQNLDRAVFQAREYWNYTYGEYKAPYVILCNFKEMWVYNWFKQDAHLAKIKIQDLETNWKQIAFLGDVKEECTFENDVEKTTIDAATILSVLHRSIVSRGETTPGESPDC